MLFAEWQDKIKPDLYVQSTLVISKSKGPSETLRDIRSLTYQMCRIEENTNRSYPENANSNTCAPHTLKFHIFCGLCVTKQCFKFELDILNSSGVIAT